MDWVLMREGSRPLRVAVIKTKGRRGLAAPFSGCRTFTLFAEATPFPLEPFCQRHSPTGVADDRTGPLFLGGGAAGITRMQNPNQIRGHPSHRGASPKRSNPLLTLSLGTLQDSPLLRRKEADSKAVPSPSRNGMPDRS